MKKIFTTLLILSFIISLIFIVIAEGPSGPAPPVPDTIAPSVTLLTENPSDPATFSPGASYEFNATITDSSGILAALLEFDGVNYTASSIGDIYNVTLFNLAVGNYVYLWSATDSSPNQNVNNTEGGTYDIIAPPIAPSNVSLILPNISQGIPYLKPNNAYNKTGAGIPFIKL